MNGKESNWSLSKNIMIYYEPLTDDNFILYCAKHYTNPTCQSTDEFFDDLKRIKYIKKLLTRYEHTGELKERLILNHIIILNNLFGPIHTPRILLFKIENHRHLIKPFLLLLNILPTIIYNIGNNNENINTDEIPLEQNIVKALRNI